MALQSELHRASTTRSVFYCPVPVDHASHAWIILLHYFPAHELQKGKGREQFSDLQQLVLGSPSGSHDSYFVLFPGFTCRTSHAPSAQMQQCDNVTGGIFDGMILSIRGSAIYSLTMLVYGGPAHPGALESK
ncbi:hypothetical protein GQ55_9G517500 [Panicum hallii var. hallii]|uniref:Uncharacterized protein n=1 Tax=Panicum hallii var. hallii TaxID=1504633 RepID=A0A2T7CE28_9POAL|nr:hypothetical protein GQ55_9G517500 [Panicum hallii var. hallii]